MKTIPFSQAFALVANSYAVDVCDENDVNNLLLPTCEDNEIVFGSHECGGIYTITEEFNKNVQISYDNELTFFDITHEKLVIRCLQIMKIS